MDASLWYGMMLGFQGLKRKQREARDDALKDLCFCNKTDQSKYFVSYTEYILDFG